VESPPETGVGKRKKENQRALGGEKAQADAQEEIPETEKGESPGKFFSAVGRS